MKEGENWKINFYQVYLVSIVHLILAGVVGADGDCTGYRRLPELIVRLYECMFD